MDGRLRSTGFILEVKGSQSVVPEPATSASPENLIKMQILRAQTYPVSRATGGAQLALFWHALQLIPNALYSLGITFLGSIEPGLVCDQGSAIITL